MVPGNPSTSDRKLYVGSERVSQKIALIRWRARNLCRFGCNNSLADADFFTRKVILNRSPAWQRRALGTQTERASEWVTTSSVAMQGAVPFAFTAGFRALASGALCLPHGKSPRALSGWVQNDAQDLEILVEGSEASPGEISPNSSRIRQKQFRQRPLISEGHATGASRFCDPCKSSR